MTTLPIIDVTDTHLQILNASAFLDTPAHQDLMDWCATHDIDPRAIPANAPIQVDRDANTITYERQVLVNGRRIPDGEHGVVTETIRYQPEARIAPWPTSILQLAAAHTITDTPLQDALAEVEKQRDRADRAERETQERAVVIARQRDTIVGLRASIREAAAIARDGVKSLAQEGEKS
jgi:hypothetical protein